MAHLLERLSEAIEYNGGELAMISTRGYRKHWSLPKKSADRKASKRAVNTAHQELSLSENIAKWDEGISMGFEPKSAGLLVLDVDEPDSPDGTGMDERARLLRDLLGLPAFELQSPSGGYHLYYRVREDFKGRGKNAFNFYYAGEKFGEVRYENSFCVLYAETAEEVELLATSLEEAVDEDTGWLPEDLYLTLLKKPPQHTGRQEDWTQEAADRIRNAARGDSHEVTKAVLWEFVGRGSGDDSRLREAYKTRKAGEDGWEQEYDNLLQGARDKARPTFPDSDAGFEEALASLGYRVSMNEMDGSVWVSKDGGEPAQITDGWSHYIRYRLEELGMAVPEGKRPKPYKLDDKRWRQALGAVCHVNAFNPIHDYFESLPEWDGKDRSDIFFWDEMPMKAERTELNVAAFRSFLLAAVYRALGNVDSQLPPVPIFQSTEQGIGKSSFVLGLVPPDKRHGEWAAQGLDLTVSKKEQMESVGSAWIVEADEIGERRRSQEDRIKSFISRLSTKLRRPYAAYPVDITHRFVLVGTTNSMSPLKSDEANRRYVVIRCLGQQSDTAQRDVFRIMDENRDQLWAQQYALFKAGEDFALVGHSAEQRKANQAFTYSNEAIIEAVEKFWRMRPAKYYRLTEVMVGSGATQPGDSTIPSRDSTVQTKYRTALKQVGARYVEDRVDSEAGERVRNKWERPPHIPPAFEVDDE